MGCAATDRLAPPVLGNASAVRTGLVEQTHGAATGLFDPTFTYRYRLTWHWGFGPRVTFIMLNPSTATEQRADPTIRRVWRFAGDTWAPGHLDVVNLYALRATDPRQLARHPDPIGPDNDEVLLKAAAGADVVVAAWGGKGRTRGQEVRRVLAHAGVQLHALRVNRDGTPAHPLYLCASSIPRLWPE